MTIKAKIDGLFSVDLPDPSTDFPEDPEDCWIIVMADIGLEGSPGADEFTFYVCTPKRLSKVVQHEGFQFGRHLLIVERFDWDTVERAIARICEEATGDTWEQVAKKIGRYGQWEFEDYQEEPVWRPKEE